MEIKPACWLKCFEIISPKQFSTFSAKRNAVKAHLCVPKHDPPNESALSQLQEFVTTSKRLVVVTGAGVSTESGIPDYRSEEVGRYNRSKYRPVQYSEFVDNPVIRQRFWARNFIGWPWFDEREPNESHKAIAKWEKAGLLHWLITQNVDGLHQKSGSKRLSELHGNGSLVRCLSCQKLHSRKWLQGYMSQLNPDWTAKAKEVAPDGDVDLSEAEMSSFHSPHCPGCGGNLQPNIVFFGDNVPTSLVGFLFAKLEEADRLLVAGSSLQVFSSFRFIRRFHEIRKPIAILNIGPTRGDPYADIKISAKCGDVLSKLLI